MPNPIIAEVTRGNLVESRHRGAFVVTNHNGAVVRSVGKVSSPFFPRSAIKAFQCLPLIESGAAVHFGLNDEEIALCCSSHVGAPEHLRTARSILSKADVAEACYECGAQMPRSTEATYQLVRQGEKPQQVHHTCSGKHAGMLALAKHLDVSLTGYNALAHPVQRAVAECLTRYCDFDISIAEHGVDGCSVPTWAVPMDKLAMAFARLGSSDEAAPQWIVRAVKSHPEMIGGAGQFDTEIMQAVPRLFIKFGAEGVFCGCVPHAALGFVLKSDDGAARAAEVAIANALSTLSCWTAQEQQALKAFSSRPILNTRKVHVGELHATDAVA